MAAQGLLRGVLPCRAPGGCSRRAASHAVARAAPAAAARCVSLDLAPRLSAIATPARQPAEPRSRLPRQRTTRAAAALAGEASVVSAEARTISSAALALALCNMCRVCMSVAVLPIAAELGWQPAVQARVLRRNTCAFCAAPALSLRPRCVQGLVQSSFLWGYTASQIQGGVLADRLGGKAVIASAIVFFSVATLLTPLTLSPLVRSRCWSSASKCLADMLTRACVFCT
jgi:hypothetical protein